MLIAGTCIFIHLFNDPDAPRAFFPATVAASDDRRVTIRLGAADVPAAAGDHALIFFQRRQKFMQQSARIAAIMRSAAGPGGSAQPLVDSYQSAAGLTLGMELKGEPACAESRTCYRVTTAGSGDVTARLDDMNCRVLDISATGFSVCCNRPLEQGRIVRVTLHHARERYEGIATVQTARPLNESKWRCGLHCASDDPTNGVLSRGLHRVSMAIQRQHLRRMAGSG